MKTTQQVKAYYHRNFIKSYKQRIVNNPKLSKRFEDRLELLIKDSTSPILKDHPLIGGRAGRRSFSVTGDVRVIYEKVKDGILLHDIGTHAQVY